MKKGFTMIELIFVIVILGILAAVAIPKLAATRDDAKLAAIKTDIGTYMNAIPAWYQGQKDARISEAVSLDTNQWKPTDATTQEYTLTIDGDQCVIMAVYDQNSTAAGEVAVIGTDINVSNGYWTGDYDPIFRIIKGSGAANGVCSTLWTDMGVTEQNITMAGKKVVW